MDQFFKYDNPVMIVITKIINCIFLSMLWVICCVPIVTVGAATSALCYAVEHNIRNERGYPAGMFGKAFRSNFKKSTAVWLAVLAAEIIFFNDIRILRALNTESIFWENIYVLFAVLMGVVILYGCWVLIGIAKFENTLIQIMKNSLALMVRHIGTTFKMTGTLLMGGVIIYLIPVTVFIMPVLIVWLVSVPVEKVFVKYMKEKEVAIGGAEYES